MLLSNLLSKNIDHLPIMNCISTSGSPPCLHSGVTLGGRLATLMYLGMFHIMLVFLPPLDDIDALIT